MDELRVQVFGGAFFGCLRLFDFFGLWRVSMAHQRGSRTLPCVVACVAFLWALWAFIFGGVVHGLVS